MLIGPFRYFITKGLGPGVGVISYSVGIGHLQVSPPLDNQPISLKIIGAIPNIDRFRAPTLHCALDFS